MLREQASRNMSTAETDGILAQARAANAGIRNFANGPHVQPSYPTVSQQLPSYGAAPQSGWHAGRHLPPVQRAPPPSYATGGQVPFNQGWPPPQPPGVYHGGPTHGQTYTAFQPPHLPAGAAVAGAVAGNGMRQRATAFGGAAFYPEARRDGPVNHAVVLLQGGHCEADIGSLRGCLSRMGFPNPTVHWEPTKTMDRQTVHSEIVSLLQELNPGSNFLLIASAKDFGGIELDTDFLMNQVYDKVIRKNAEIAQKLENARLESTDAANLKALDFVTLHVLLDGIEGCTLRHAMVFAPEPGAQSQGLRAQWAKIPKTKGTRAQCQEMQTGRIVQICSHSKLQRHQSGNLLSAFIHANLAEAYLPFNVLAFRMLRMMRHDFRYSTKRQENADRGGCGVRGIEGELILGPVLATAQICYKKLHELSQRRKQEHKDLMESRGEMIFTSVNLFDPNLCFDVCWDSAQIPKP